MLTRCPFCGALTYGEIPVAAGTSYVLTTIDQGTNPPNFIPTSGLAVVVKGCSTCKKVQLECPSLSANYSAK